MKENSTSALKIFLGILLFFVCSTSHSQKKEGFYGANFFTSLDVTVHSPLIYRFLNNGKSDLLNFGFKGNFGYIVKRNFAISFEVGRDKSSVYTPDSYYNFKLVKVETSISQDSYNNSSQDSPTTLYYVDIESFDVSTFTFVPKIEFATESALLPSGLSHQIGFGVAYSKMIDKDYNPIFTKEYGNSTVILGNDFLKKKLYNFTSAEPIKSYIFMYAISMRKAITKKIFLNYGFRYSLNFRSDRNEVYTIAQYEKDHQEYFISNDQVKQKVFSQRRQNVITFNIGMTFAF